MENLRTAFSLAFIARKHISIHTDDYENCAFALKEVVLRSFAAEDIVEIDLLSCHSYKGLVLKTVKASEGKMPELYRIVLWKNLELLEIDLQVRSDLLRVFNEIERYNTRSSLDVDPKTPIEFGEFTVTIPDFFIIVPILAAGEKPPYLHRHLKDKLWFCQSYYYSCNQEIFASEISYDDVLKARKCLPTVYVNAEIQEYVCSLMVFTRSHRLCSLAPLTTRPTTRASEGILLLAKTLAVYANRESGLRLFVTPDFVKIAFRKIGYWLVDWETNDLFRKEGLTHKKRTEISLLTGDWYGSEWECVEKFLDDSRAEHDVNSTTGFTNRIVEDVLKSVSPPL